MTETPGQETFTGHLAPPSRRQRFTVRLPISEVEEKLQFVNTMRLLAITVDHRTAEVRIDGEAETTDDPKPDGAGGFVGETPGNAGRQLSYYRTEGWR